MTTTSLRSWLKTAALVAIVLCLSVGLASADTITVEGTTSGSFSILGLPLGSSVLGLSFAGSSFGPTTSSIIDLGTFSLSALLGYYDPFDFNLAVNFTLPVGAGGAALTADLSGLAFFGLGSATVDFNNTPIHIVYSDGQYAGSFDLAVLDVSVGNGSSATLYGVISNATGSIVRAVPEPGTLALVLAGLAGVAATVRYRRKGQ